MLLVLRQPRAVDSWHGVSLSMCVREWASGMRVADDAIAAGGVWVLRLCHPKHADHQGAHPWAGAGGQIGPGHSCGGPWRRGCLLLQGWWRLRGVLRGHCLLPTGRRWGLHRWGPSRAKAKAVSLPVSRSTAGGSRACQGWVFGGRWVLDREAVKRNRRGHSGNPEPPTLIWRASNGQGAIWLGGLPQEGDVNFMKEHNITQPWTRPRLNQVAIVDPYEEASFLVSGAAHCH